MQLAIQSPSLPAALEPASTASLQGPAKPLAAVVGAPLVLLRLEGAGVLAGAGFAYAALHGGWGFFALLFLLPDLAMLGYLAGPRVGAACYNATHSYLGPLLTAAVALGAHAQPALLCACIWAAHVGFDRMLGYGLKYGTAFGDTHLGRRGRASVG